MRKESTAQVQRCGAGIMRIGIINSCRLLHLELHVDYVALNLLQTEPRYLFLYCGFCQLNKVVHNVHK